MVYRELFIYCPSLFDIYFCGFRGLGVFPLDSPRNSIHFAATNASRAPTTVQFRLATLSKASFKSQPTSLSLPQGLFFLKKSLFPQKSQPTSLSLPQGLFFPQKVTFLRPLRTESAFWHAAAIPPDPPDPADLPEMGPEPALRPCLPHAPGVRMTAVTKLTPSNNSRI